MSRSKANETQVGGKHYESKFQHWDLAFALSLGYFEGNITKYVARHTKKNGLEDLQKAEHYLIKLLEGKCRPIHTRNYPGDLLGRYFSENVVGEDERLVVSAVCTWRKREDLYEALETIRRLVRHYSDPATPTAAYVDQARDI